MQETWSHVEFKFTQHKGTDVYLVKMAEEDFEALEDNQVLVQVLSRQFSSASAVYLRLMGTASTVGLLPA